MKRGLNNVVVGICASCLIGLGTPTVAGTDSSTAAQKATANVRFVIHIPETLSMSIARPDGQNRFFARNLQAVGVQAGRTDDNGQTIEVAVKGNMLTGGTMALTAQSAASRQSGGNTQHDRSSVIWTAKGAFEAEHRPGGGTDAKNADSPAPHTFSFSRKHPFQPGPIDRQLVYTVSAP